MTTLEHVALKVKNLDQTEAFYSALGARTSCHAAGKRLFVEFDVGTRLIFDVVDSPFTTDALTYLGLELDSDDALDALFTRLSERGPIARDVREEYRHATGPYGFFVNDPDGYVLKIFKYHD